MRPEARVLLVKPQISPTDCLRAQSPSSLLIFSVFITDSAIRDGMHDVNSILTKYVTLKGHNFYLLVRYSALRVLARSECAAQAA